ncbi:MAG TPA: ABC transporter permease [Candidatus Polarisedimenticolia bacterium]|jgi:ABC-2 type transport system permease protein|nr:ABC transporter permease [Candidatus Polarisedimenticolia bacterium]
MTDFIQETRAQMVRWLIHLRRERFSLIFALVSPITFLVFFGGAFSGMAPAALPGGSYRTFILPGIIALTVFGSSLSGGIELLFDKESGTLTRILAAPISRASILVSRFLYVNLVASLQVLIVVTLAYLLGVRIATGLAGLVALLILGLFLGFSLTIVSLVLAFSLTNHGEFFAILSFLTLPLAFLSTAFVPLEKMPGWMAALARVNPMTYAVNGMRTLVVSGWDWPGLLRMAAVLLVFDAVSLVLGSLALRRRIS